MISLLLQNMHWYKWGFQECQIDKIGVGETFPFTFWLPPLILLDHTRGIRAQAWQDKLLIAKLPDNVEAHLHLVSSRAREGLNHSLSGLVDCSWQGKLTLELKNILKYGYIALFPNLRVAQLSFWEYQENAQNPYRGRYFGDTTVSAVKDGADVLLT